MFNICTSSSLIVQRSFSLGIALIMMKYDDALHGPRGTEFQCQDVLTCHSIFCSPPFLYCTQASCFA